MAVAFRELGGSPVEQYGADGFSAWREFLIAWEDRDQFALEVLGQAAACGGRGGIGYPGKPGVRAVSLRLEPFDPERPDHKPLADLARDLNSYSGSFAKAKVEYRTVVSSRPDDPKVPEGTYLTYRMRFSAEYVPLVARGWQWRDNPAIPVPDDLQITLSVPITEHHVTWHRVVNPPWGAIRALQGKVNASPFLGAAPGTLLLEGADADKQFQTGYDLAYPELFWRVHYVFRERAIKFGGQVYGWNHHFREKPAGWVELVRDGKPLYESADFSPLFQFAATQD